MFGLFRKPTAEERARTEAVKGWVRHHLAVGPETTVSVSEIDCGDAACPGTETVILVMRPGLRTRAYKVQAPLIEVDAQKVIDALAVPEI